MFMNLLVEIKYIFLLIIYKTKVIFKMSLQDSLDLEFGIILITFFHRIKTFLTLGESPQNIMSYLMIECTLAK
jgi:hypothetical protein